MCRKGEGLAGLVPRQLAQHARGMPSQRSYDNLAQVSNCFALTCSDHPHVSSSSARRRHGVEVFA